MIPALLQLLFLVVVAGVLWWVFTTLVPLPEPFAKVAKVIIVLVLLIALFGILFGYGGFSSGGPLLRIH